MSSDFALQSRLWCVSRQSSPVSAEITNFVCVSLVVMAVVVIRVGMVGGGGCGWGVLGIKC